MPELIDRAKVQTEIALIAKHLARSDAQKAIIGRILFMIDNMQAIEPEVRHGRMIEGRYPNENKCSECGQTFRDDIRFIIQDDGGVFQYPKRCPECGCFWDGGADK